jgi:hypothetical protein
MDTIGNDVSNDQNTAGAFDADEFGIDDAAELFLKRMTPDPAKPASKGSEEEHAPKRSDETESDDGEETTDEESGDENENDHADEDTSDEGDETEDEDGEQPERKLASDDNEVEIAIGDETKRVSVKDLKRLYGQEASLTRKSQEVADQRKQAETVTTLHATALQRMHQRASERWEPFKGIDFMQAMQRMTPDEFSQLRAAAKSAYDDVQFFDQELKQHTQAVQQEQGQKWAQSAQECVKVLVDPEKGIKGWNQKMYEDLRSFADENGLAPEYYNRLTDPSAFKLIRMAQQYAKAQKVGVKKVAQAPKNLARTKNTRTQVSQTEANQQKALRKLRSSGDVEDAADVFLQRWNAADDSRD